MEGSCQPGLHGANVWDVTSSTAAASRLQPLLRGAVDVTRVEAAGELAAVRTDAIGLIKFVAERCTLVRSSLVWWFASSWEGSLSFLCLFKHHYAYTYNATAWHRAVIPMHEVLQCDGASDCVQREGTGSLSTIQGTTYLSICFFIFNLCVDVWVCGQCVNTYAGAYRDQKRVSDLPRLKLQAELSCPVLVLGTELQSFARTASMFSHPCSPLYTPGCPVLCRLSMDSLHPWGFSMEDKHTHTN